jgi:Homing endonuclease associated repeat
MLGHSSSLAEYRELRIRSPELALIADTTIRRVLGPTWNDCLQRALLDGVSEGDFLTCTRTSPFTLDEIVTAVHEYVDEHDGCIPATELEFLAWAHDPKVQARPGRRPLDYRTFARFDGFEAVLRAGGFATEGARRHRARRGICQVCRYSDDELRAAVQNVAATLGRNPSSSDYFAAHGQCIERLKATGEGRILPGLQALHSRWGPWPNVLIEAGLLSTETSRVPRRTRYSEAELITWISRAWVSVGEPFTQNAYRTWRRNEFKSAAARGEHPHIPTPETIRYGFGSWAIAIKRTLPSDRRARPRD